MDGVKLFGCTLHSPRRLRNPHEPVLNSVNRYPLAPPADLRREHCAVVLIVKTEPREESHPFLRRELLDGDPDLGAVKGRFVVVRVAIVLRRASHQANRCSVISSE